MIPFMDDGVFKEIIPKIKEHCLRLCLILHCIEHAVANTNELTLISESTMQKAITLTKWVYAHQIKTWKMVVSRLNEPDRQPVECRVAQAIVDLENEVEGGFLSTAQIVKQVNDGYPPKFHMSNDKIGRLCSDKLKLTSNKNHNPRGWLVNTEVISQLKKNFDLTG